jgi:dipeptidyl aminopeptidase/acylaminoacyl peptidase
MRSLLLCVVAACGSPSDNGTIVRDVPCVIPSDAVFSTELGEFLTKEYTSAGLDPALANHSARALAATKLVALRTASAEGRCRSIQYRSDGVSVEGFILRPVATQRTPAVIYLRGGNGEFGKVTSYSLARLNDLVARGYTVLATQYRGVAGAAGKDEFGGADLADVKNLVEVAKRQPDVDPSRLFIYGHSRGAMQTAMALRAGLPVKAAVLQCGPYDLEAWLPDRPDMVQVLEQRIPEWTTDRAGALERRSAVRWPSELRVPVLLLAGEHDHRVRIGQARALDEALTRINHPHRLITFPDEHQLLQHHDEVIEAIDAWFKPVP